MFYISFLLFLLPLILNLNVPLKHRFSPSPADLCITAQPTIYLLLLFVLFSLFSSFNVVEMIKYVTNEPSVGLYYAQQHTHNALPNLLRLQDRVENKARDYPAHSGLGGIHCGHSVTHDMISDTNKSLLLISTSQPKSGLIRSTSSGFRGGNSSFGDAAVLSHGSAFAQQEVKSSGGYLSAVLKFPKEKAVNIRWP